MVHRCIACGKKKDDTEFFTTHVCTDCFATHDRHGRSRKVMRDQAAKQQQASKEADRPPHTAPL